MKLFSVLMTTVILFCAFSTFSQEQEIKLNLKEGYEYTFERIEKNNSLREDGSKLIIQNETKKFKIEIEKNVPDSFLIFTYKILESFEEGSARKGLINRTDRIYPAFNENQATLTHARDYIESLLTKGIYRFSVNLKTKEFELLNRFELLENFHSILIEKGNNDREIQNAITHLNKERFFIPEQELTFLTKFHHSKITDKNILSNEKYIVKEKKGDFVNFGNQDIDNIVSGKEYQKFWINLENGLITNSSTIHYDSIKTKSWSARFEKVRWRVNETNFQLLNEQKVPQNYLVLSGKIENPLSGKIHVKILEKPFGTEMKTRTYLLDANGSFSEIIDYFHEGFIYVENENNNKHQPPATWVFYAEPGDTIEFELTGSEENRQSKFSGTRKTEANFINELREKIVLGKSSSLTWLGGKVLDYDLAYYFGVRIVNGEPVLEGDVEPLFNAIDKLEKISEKYKSQISEEALNFISNEFKAYFLRGIFYFGGRIISSSDLSMLEHPIEIGYEELRSKIDSIDAHKVYNDFGLHSREYITQYLDYHFTKTNKVKTREIISYGFHFEPGTQLKIQFSRMVLAGSPLYRQIANDLSDILVERIGSQHYSREEYLVDFALNNFDLLMKLCNDTELINEANLIVEQHQKLQNQSYLPRLEFYNREKEKAAFEDFKGDKPSIFYFSSNWIGGRYEYDNLVDKYPSINFIMVLEGNNFRQWEEYTIAADPKAIHLLYFNDSLNFADIFHKQSTHLVFDKNAEFVGYSRNIDEAIKEAEATLTPKKKELNKSQLIIIIILLGAALLFVILFFFFMKWRVRKRLRQEEQQRRLRELELTAIRSQMNPHFLFNCLNSVQNLVQQNKGREAHLYLADFAGLIRKVLQNSEKEEVSLAEELEMVQQYLNLEKLRFDFNFQITTGEGIDPHNTLVPPMLLQPFAENAVIHGLQHKEGEKKLKIEVSREQTRLAVSNRLAHKAEDTRLAVDNRLAHSSSILIRIEDNGIGRAAAKNLGTNKNGKGSKLMQERLKILQEKQGEKYRLQIIDLTENGATGTRVEIWIPEEK